LTPIPTSHGSYGAARERQQRRERVPALERGAACLVRLDLLGGIEAFARDPGAGDAPGTKPLVLLAYLHLAEPVGAKSRDELATLFWPEKDQAHSHRSLRQAVFQLRSHFGSDVVRSVGKHQLRLTPGVVWSDVQLFRGLCTNDRWEGALDLYRRDFLRGVHVTHASWELEEWIQEQRHALRTEGAGCALRMSEAATRDQDYRSAIDWALQALEVGDHGAEILEEFFHFCASAERADLAWRVYEHHVLWLEGQGLPGPDPCTRVLFRKLFPDLRGPELYEAETSATVH
jgi:DNA-binding SARP family transcriptional activator